MDIETTLRFTPAECDLLNRALSKHLATLVPNTPYRNMSEGELIVLRDAVRNYPRQEPVSERATREGLFRGLHRLLGVYRHDQP